MQTNLQVKPSSTLNKEAPAYADLEFVCSRKDTIWVRTAYSIFTAIVFEDNLPIRYQFHDYDLNAVGKQIYPCLRHLFKLSQKNVPEQMRIFWRHWTEPADYLATADVVGYTSCYYSDSIQNVYPLDIKKESVKLAFNGYVITTYDRRTEVDEASCNICNNVNINVAATDIDAIYPGFMKRCHLALDLGETDPANIAKYAVDYTSKKAYESTGLTGLNLSGD